MKRGLKYWIFLPGLLVASVTAGQNRTTLTEANADCSGIIDLLAKDTVFGPTTAPAGPGKTLEISGDKNSLTAFEKEHNTVWYRFKVPYDGVFTFEVIPLNIRDDYDFILYKYSGKNFCAEVAGKTARPVRTCISRNDPAQGSVTGLKKEAQEELVHSGPGPSWCKPLPVKKGEIYVLVLDNVYPNGKGHTLKLHFSKTVAPVIRQVTEQVAPHETVAPKYPRILFKVIDKETKRPVKANIEIINKRDPEGTPLLKADSTSGSEASLALNTAYFLRAEAIGYFGYIYEIKTSNTVTDLNHTVTLERIAAGKNVVFDNILFYGDQARFLPESNASLQTLARTMVQNPKLVIEVEGHVNWPKMMQGNDSEAMQNHNQTLSEDRARAVVEYLISKGIDKDRMTWVGYGSTRMLYPEARSEEEMKQNRRVEIKIVSNE